MITGSSKKKKKTTCELLLGAGSNQQSRGKTRDTKAVCFFKGNVIEKHSRFYIIRYQELRCLPPSPPSPCQLLYEFRQQRGRRQFPVLLKGISRQLFRPGRPAGRAAGEGGGRPGEGGGEDHIVFQMTEQGFIYQLALFYMKKKSNNSPNPSI